MGGKLSKEREANLEREAEEERAQRKKLETEVRRLRVAASVPLGPSWRDIRWDSCKEMLTKTREYQTDLERVPKVNLLLVGMVSSGKSSFINSIDTMFKGRIAGREEARSAESGCASITRHFNIRQPGGRRDKDVGFNVCDTMGMEHGSGLSLDDLVYVLDGNVPDGFQFRADTLITPDSKGFVSNPTWKEKMHLVAYVMDGTKVQLTPGDFKQKFDRLRALASARGIRVVILVTHIDEVCEEVQANVRTAHESVAVKVIVDKINELTGLPLSYIYLVKNYCRETALNNDVNALNLTALQKMLDFADDILDGIDQTESTDLLL